MWRKRVAIGLGATGVAVVVAVVGTVITVHVEHPRDESAYLAYLRQYGSTESDDPLVLPADAATLIAQGDRACDWLGHQGYALWRTDQSHRVFALYQRYDALTESQPLPWAGDPSHDSIASAAWAHLCPASLDLHKPHFVFSSSQPD